MGHLTRYCPSEELKMRRGMPSVPAFRNARHLMAKLWLGRFRRLSLEEGAANG